jgi:diguanylate cyclase (GGDEF)-like protein
MICDPILKKFISILSSSEDTVGVSQRAIGLIAPEYGIGQVRLFFAVGNTHFTPGGDVAERWLYQSEEAISSREALVKSYSTGENGRVILRVNYLEDAPNWTDEQRDDMDVLMEILFVYLGRHRLISQAQKNSLTDYMTGLPNADGFVRYLGPLYAKHQLTAYNSYYFNLSGFGLLNRRFGQKETDEIVKRYAKKLQHFMEGEEIAGRLGGDNFVALVRKERTDEFLEFLSGVEIYGNLNGERIPLVIKAYVGVYRIDQNMRGLEAVLNESGVALNAAKHILNQPVVFADRELNQHIFKQKQIAASFPDALEREEFVVYYQPKVDTADYTLVGAEALVRWFSNGKIISPGDFIPVIEQDGSVCKLDFYMLDHVCRDIRQWMDSGIEPVRISVNFSRKHLSNDHLFEDIMEVIDRYNVPSHFIEIEVTETTDDEEKGKLNSFMGKMRQNQIATAIDDFGTGYSSLNMLRSFPIDVLKIDKSFIDNEKLTNNDTIVLSHIVRMAQELHMDVITEGVEQEEQMKFLQDLGCNVVQGFLFDRPMPEVEFVKRLRERRYDPETFKLKSEA